METRPLGDHLSRLYWLASSTSRRRQSTCRGVEGRLTDRRFAAVGAAHMDHALGILNQPTKFLPPE